MLKKMKQFTKKDNLTTSTLIYFIGTMLLRSVSLISMPFFTRYMSQADYGLYSLYSTTLGLLAIFIGLQVQSTVTLKFAHFEKERFEQYLSNVTLVPIIIFVLCLLVSGVFRIESQGLGLPNVFVTLTIVVQAFYLTLHSIYLSNLIIKKQPKKHLVVSLLTTGLMVGLSIFFTVLLKSNSFYGRVLGSTLASLLMSIPLLFALLRKVNLNYFIEDGKSALSLSIPLIFHTVSGQILNASDRYILQHYISESQLAVYSFIYSVSTIIQMVWASINNAWVPWYYENLRDRNRNAIKRNSIVYILVFTALTAAFLLVAPEIVLVLGGMQYQNSLQYLSVLVLGNYCVFMYSFYVNYQFFKQNTRIIPIATMFAAIINIVLNLIFIPRFGIWAATISTLVSYFFMFLFHYFVVRFQYRHDDFPVWILMATFGLVSGLALMLQLTSYNLMVRLTFVLLSIIFLAIQSKKLYLIIKQ